MRMYHKILAFLMSVIMLCSMSLPALACKNSSTPTLDTQSAALTPKEDPRNYPKNTKERYIASIAFARNISYEQAEEYVERTPMTIASDDVIRYQTIDQCAYTYDAQFDAEVWISAEVQYVYNRGTHSKSIVSIGEPYTYVYGTTIKNSSFDHGGYNTYVTGAARGRISVTGSFTIESSDTGITFGGDILNITTTAYGVKFTTHARTYSINFTIS